MKSKQWIALLLALCLAFCLCACSKPQQPANTEPAAETDAPTEAQPTESAPAAEPIEDTETPELPENRGKEMLLSLRTTVTGETAADYDFSELALDYLTYIGENLQNRSFGGHGDNNTHDAAGDWIIAELKSVGYLPQQIEEQRFEGTSMYGDVVEGRNIVVTVPGLDASGEIIVGAHYDGDGLGDNGSGVALLLATAVGLHNVTPQYTLHFVFFDGENDGFFGSNAYAANMSAAEVENTIYMINLDALVFGDFCNIYGGTFGDYSADYIAVSDDVLPEPENTEAYSFATETARTIGQKVYITSDLDGYFTQNGKGMDPEPDALFTNPWTNRNPAPDNYLAPSPATLPNSSHVSFTQLGIEYISLGATNWFAAGTEPFFAYTGSVETYSTGYGFGGMFSKTEFDTLEVLNQSFPDRAAEHYALFSPLLCALLLVES